MANYCFLSQCAVHAAVHAEPERAGLPAASGCCRWSIPQACERLGCSERVPGFGFGRWARLSFAFTLKNPKCDPIHVESEWRGGRASDRQPKKLLSSIQRHAKLNSTWLQEPVRASGRPWWRTWNPQSFVRNFFFPSAAGSMHGISTAHPTSPWACGGKAGCR